MSSFLNKIKSSASLLALIGMALRVGGGMLTLPIALRVLPQEEMGLYYSFMGILGLASLLDFGFGATISRNAAYAMGGASALTTTGVPKMNEFGEPNIELLTILVSAVRRWYRYVAIVLFLILSIGGGFVINNQLRQSNLPQSLLVCWLLFSANASYAFLTTCWPDLLVGIGSVRTNAIYSVLTQILALIILVAGLLLHLGLWSYVASSFISAAVGRHLCKNAFYRDSGVAIDTEDPEALKQVLVSLWPMAWRQGLVMIGAFLVQRGSTIICSNFLGLAETAKFGLSLNLLNIVFQVSNIPLMMVLPKICSLRVSRDLHTIKKLFFSRTYVGLLVALLAIFVLIYSGDFLLEIIGSKTRLLGSSVFILLCAILWLENHHVAYCNLVLTQNQNPFVPLAIISGIIVFIVSWLGAKWYGVVGMLFAQAIVQLLWANWWPVLLGLKSLRRSVNLPGSSEDIECAQT